MAHGCELSTYDHENSWLVRVPAAPAAMEDVKDEQTVSACVHTMREVPFSEAVPDGKEVPFSETIALV